MLPDVEGLLTTTWFPFSPPLPSCAGGCWMRPGSPQGGFGFGKQMDKKNKGGTLKSGFYVVGTVGLFFQSTSSNVCTYSACQCLNRLKLYEVAHFVRQWLLEFDNSFQKKKNLCLDHLTLSSTQLCNLFAFQYIPKRILCRLLSAPNYSWCRAKH